MNQFDEGLLPAGIETYALNNSSAEMPVLQKLTRATHLRTHHPQMLSGHMQGLFLQHISKMLQPGRILEIGTFTGYSAICLAQGLRPDGVLITIELSEELADFTIPFFTEAGLENKIVQLTGDAAKLIPTLTDEFDLVFLDADKESYIQYFDAVLPKVRSGGYILADNTLWYGRVIDANASSDRETASIIRFNSYVNEHPAVENVLLPLRDGIMMMRKI